MRNALARFKRPSARSLLANITSMNEPGSASDLALESIFNGQDAAFTSYEETLNGQTAIFTSWSRRINPPTSDGNYPPAEA